jgi:hypothetical protein
MFDRNKYKFFSYFYFMIDQYKHKQLQIGLVSPQQIRAWAKKILPNGEVVGEVTRPSTFHYMLFYISMNLGTFACIVLFGLRTRTDNIRNYAIIHERSFFGSLFSPMSLIPRRPSSTSRFLRKTLSILVWMASRPIFLSFNRTPYEHSFYLLLSKNNQVINDWTKPRNNPLCAKL